MNTVANHSDRSEIKIVTLISLLAALHVFIFTAAFPFFNIVDEVQHFDLVVRYSHGDLPQRQEPLSPEAARYVALYHSLAAFADPAQLPGGKLLPPPWTLPMEKVLPIMLAREAEWKKIINPEDTMPPLYYASAGVWWNLGKFIGLGDERLLYWLRFFNLPIVVGVVWLGWFTARRIFPENIFVRLAVPALIALMPQTAFYSINSDILPPLLFGGVFFLLLKFWETQNVSWRLAAGIGLLLAANFLTKTSTLPLLAVSALFIGIKMFQRARQGKFRATVPAFALLLACATLPITGWMFWCKINFGDLTGSALKIQALGWTAKPFSAWFEHPIFSPGGLWTFLGDTFSTFWQGEFYWLRRPLAIPALDIFYAIFTAILLLLGFLAARKNPPHRYALWFAFAGLAMTFCFYALLSVKFDFHDCFYPSRAYPYFTSGRLFLGLLIPVMILLASGLDYALKSFSPKMKFTVLVAWLIFMVAGETAVDWRVFPNEYNWYHL